MFDFNGIKVVSYFPGRVRLRVEKLKHNAKFAREIDESLGAIDGIKKLEVKEDTASVLVVYDKKRLKQPDNAEELITRLHDLFPEVDGAKIRKLLGI